MVRRRLLADDGSAVVTAIVLVVVGLTLAAAATVAATNVLRGSVRDEQSKDALAAADAGLQIAIWRYNQVAANDSLPCVVESLSGELIAAAKQGDGWCAPVSGTVGESSWTYRVRPTLVNIDVPGTGSVSYRRRVEVVATGTSGNGFQDALARRVEVAAVAPTGSAVFGGAGAIGVDDVHLTGSAVVNGPSGTNASMTIDSSAQLCGDAQHGRGGRVNFEGSGSQCEGYTQTESLVVLAPPNQGDAPTNNSNGRIGSPTAPTDPFTGPPSQYDWNASTRTLTMASNVTLTLGASDLPYSFCRLKLEGNSALIIGQGAKVRIFFDTPENCGLAAGTAQLEMLGNSKIITTSGNPADAQLLFVGSDTTSSDILLSGNSAQNNFTIYAPRHDIEVTGNGKYSGAIAGKSLTAGGSAEINVDDRALGVDVGVLIRYVRERYVECGPSGSIPDANC